MTREEMIELWTERQKAFARVHAIVDGAQLVGEILDHLRFLEESRKDAVLTLKAAAEQSGYSVEHLARLVRQGRIPNAGRLSAPRIRAADLPTRKCFARTNRNSYNVETDARSLRNERQ